MAVPATQVSRTAAVPAPLTDRTPTTRERVGQLAERSPGLGRGLLWISVVAALLAGIVALNVAVLQLRMERGRVSSDIATIRAENAAIEAQLATAAAAGRIEAIARARLGLREPATTIYVKLPSSAK
jgi:hypothetical protein